MNNRTIYLRVSLYADDTAVFVNPIKEDILTVAAVLDLFGKASGLQLTGESRLCIPLGVKALIYMRSCKVLSIKFKLSRAPIWGYRCISVSPGE